MPRVTLSSELTVIHAFISHMMDQDIKFYSLLALIM